MKLFCISILLGILQFSGLQAQGTALLRDFDFAQPGYSIILLPIDRLGRWSDTMQVKYYDHSQALETFKRELTGFEPARVYRFACFDDYAMVVARGGKQEARLTVSQNCHSISSPQGEFTFWGYNFVEGQKIAKAGRINFKILQRHAPPWQTCKVNRDCSTFLIPNGGNMRAFLPLS
jgi:hypothetical protein